MFRHLVHASLHSPLLVAGLVVGIFAAGAFQLREMPVDALPEFSPVYVEVQTESLGLSAVEVEQLITAPMEQLLLNGVPWLEDISSESIPGLSSIVLVFEAGTDPLEARQVVQERLSQGRDLPKVAKAPVMLQPLSSTSRVMMVRVDSDELSPIEQSMLAKWTVKPALMGVPGVANVAIWGQREQQMQVQVDSARLAQRGVSLSQVVTTSANSLWVSPLSFVEASTPGTGGFIDTPNQRLGVHHILPITRPADLARVPLEGQGGKPVLGNNGKPVRLGDVVTVVEDHQPLIGDAVAGESQGLMLVIEKFPEANALEVTERVEDTLAALAPGLEGIEFQSDVYRPASYIDIALRTAGGALVAGLLLLLLLLGVVHGWRLAVVAAITVPLSLVVAAMVLYLSGTSMNLMLWAGMMVAATAVVDETVLAHDHARRRLGEAQSERRDRRGAVATAVATIQRPLLIATLIMLAATVPLFYVGFRRGLDADFFLPVVVSYALALAASLVIALVVAPTLTLAVFGRGRVAGEPSRVAGRLGALYGRVVTRGPRIPTVAAAVFGVIAVAGLVVTPFLDVDMKPSPAERTLLIHWSAASGTSHQEMSRITGRVTAEIEELPGIANVGAHIGRALTSDQVANINAGELWVSLESHADHGDAMSAVRDIVSGYPGIEHEVLTYTDERSSALGVGTTTPDDVVVRVFGQEYDVLADKAEEVRRSLSEINGVGEATVQVQPREAQIEVKVDLASARRYGVTPGEVRRAAATLVSGIEVGNLFERQKVFEVVVLGTPEARHDMSVVEDLLIDSPTADPVRLGDVARVGVVPVPTSVGHNSVSRYIDVVADVDGRGSRDVAEEAEEALASIQFPLEYHAEILGDYAREQASITRALGFAVAALVLMLLLFQAYLQSWRLAILAFMGLPLALSGALLVAAAAGTGLDIGVLLGLLTITGIYTRSALLLLGRFRAVGARDRDRADDSMVLYGDSELFLPTVVSALAVAALLLPGAVLGPEPGLEVIHPMAVVTLGGLVTTTALTLICLPLVYQRFTPDPVSTATEVRAGEKARPL